MASERLEPPQPNLAGLLQSAVGHSVENFVAISRSVRKISSKNVPVRVELMTVRVELMTVRVELMNRGN